MLTTREPEPFHRPGRVYEEKSDGFRIVAYKETLGLAPGVGSEAMPAEVAAAMRAESVSRVLAAGRFPRDANVTRRVRPV